MTMIDTSVHQFTWGQTVRLRTNPYVPERAGSLAEVCGVVPIQTVEHAQSVFGGSIGEVAYLIEFGDGVAIEVVGELLEST
jgi:hypothetical protein